MILCVKFISVNHLLISLIYLFNIFCTSLHDILDIFVVICFFIEFSFSSNHGSRQELWGDVRVMYIFIIVLT